MLPVALKLSKGTRPKILFQGERKLSWDLEAAETDSPPLWGLLVCIHSLSVCVFYESKYIYVGLGYRDRKAINILSGRMIPTLRVRYKTFWVFLDVRCLACFERLWSTCIVNTELKPS